jgi:hypothetical protein
MPCDTKFGAWRIAGFGSRKPPSAPDPSSACEWMSINPGATYLPVASMTRVALASASVPTATIRPPRTPTSAGNQGLPVPSRTRALRIRRSNVAGGCCGIARPATPRATTRNGDQTTDFMGRILRYASMTNQGFVVPGTAPGPGTRLPSLHATHTTSVAGTPYPVPGRGR